MDIPDNHPRADLDAVDLQLLRLLSEDSRQSQRSLARELGMSPPAVAERMNRLERSGVIRNYSIDVDWGSFGLPLLAFIDVVTVPGAVQRRLLERVSLMSLDVENAGGQ
ncbi:MAG: Lrp/AsnC family transcriptional regulator [Ornithinimicrobium sp.]|jgi:DNA-binding Lrp family transcriptional regulator|uniref:Lrp/AsnC family transcriptional regulator n=1 Tax=Ornithinimicrobium sp. TaxID=1977084 RepID=UPI003D9B8792